MSKYIIAYDLHKPDTTDENYDLLDKTIVAQASSSLHAKKILNTTFIIQSQSGPQSISLAIGTVVSQHKLKCDFFVSEYRQNTDYYYKDGHVVSRTSY